ncbi:hypothetical protein ACJW31_03G107300 [Castanea mollissima]
MQQEPPSHSTSIAPSSAIDLPHVQAEQTVGLPVVAEGRPKRISKAPPCGTGGHKHGHNAGPEASDEEHARPPPHYTRRHKIQKRFQVLYLAVKTVRESGHQHVYSAVERPLQLAQAAAILEIFHSLVGLVRSPTQTHILVTCLVISWSITEIIRYSFFGLKEALGFAPSWLLWLRYSTFLCLYPTGISSEVGLIYVALPFSKESEKYCIRMPNKWNFSFDFFYAAILALGIYVPGSPHMYGYMLGQRKKALSKSKKE